MLKVDLMEDLKSWKEVKLRAPEDFERKEPVRLAKGINRLKFLDDGRDIEVEDYNDPQKKVKKVVFNVKMISTGDQKVLFVNYGETKLSLFGQLQEISRKLGTLENHELAIVSTSGDKNTRYSVIEVDREPVE